MFDAALIASALNVLCAWIAGAAIRAYNQPAYPGDVDQNKMVMALLLYVAFCVGSIAFAVPASIVLAKSPSLRERITAPLAALAAWAGGVVVAFLAAGMGR